MKDPRLEYLKQRITNHSKYIAAFANSINIPPSTLESLLKKSNLGNVGIDTILPICKALNINVDDLYNYRFNAPAPLLKLPIVGSVSCGNGVIAHNRIDGYYSTPSDWLKSGEYFYLVAKGNSMYPRIKDGNHLLFRSQNTIENGQIAAVFYQDEIFCKKIIKQHNVLMLQSENTEYEPIVHHSQSNATFHVFGLLKKIIAEV